MSILLFSFSVINFYHSCHGAEGRDHPEQVTILSEGCHSDMVTFHTYLKSPPQTDTGRIFK